MNIAGVSYSTFRPSGGADNVVVNDLAGAGLGQLIADLANDGAADVVEIKEFVGCKRAPRQRRHLDRRHRCGGQRPPGTGRERQAEPRCRCGQRSRCRRGRFRKRHDRRGSVNCCPHVAVAGGPGGLPIDVVNAEALAIESLAGNDTLNAGLGLAALTQLTLDGGAGNDAINGGDGGTRCAARRKRRDRRKRRRRGADGRRRRLVHVGPRRRQRQGGRRGRQRHDGLQRRRSR